MKKLLMMFVMLLGSVATIQAQSFDFSCSSSSAAVTTFTDVERTQLVNADFTQGRFQNDNSDEYFPLPNHYADQFMVGQQYGGVSIDFEILDESFQFRAIAWGPNSRTVNVYASFDAALASAMNSRGSLSDDYIQMDFTQEEVVTLEDDSSFEVNVAVSHLQYSRIISAGPFPEDDTIAHIRVYEGQFIATVDGEGSANADVPFDTLQEAMDFISSFIYTAN